jgi:hypothetical protein
MAKTHRKYGLTDAQWMGQVHGNGSRQGAGGVDSRGHRRCQMIFTEIDMAAMQHKQARLERDAAALSDRIAQALAYIDLHRTSASHPCPHLNEIRRRLTGGEE